MVVDDEPAICDMLTTVLSDEGYQSVAVSSGAEALARAAAERPDLFLIDLMMPGMDGRTLAARLRAMPEMAATPIIMMSAAVRTMATPPGVAEFLAKPFDLDQLLDSLERAIGARGSGGAG
jgi:CheY-like chemotaxis protein